MKSMICFDCVLKHLSAALSFGKEILSGHGLGSDLDHRIDFLGEIVNSEQHLELIDKNIFTEISDFRKRLQGENILISNSDLEFIRAVFLKVERLKLNPVKNPTETSSFYTELEKNPVIVYEKVTNKDWFDLSYKTVKENCKDFSKIVVLKTEVPLEEVEVLNLTLKEFVETATEDFILIPENSGFNKTFSAKKIFNSFSFKLPENFFPAVPEFLRKKGIEETVGCYDNIKPQVINPAKMREVLEEYYGEFPVTIYCYFQEKNRVDDLTVTAFADRKVCCGLKRDLESKNFVRWNETGFEFYKSYLDEKENIKEK